ncbi:tRNA (uridine(34)/cytosine(34)/5-carboxymethylaminomethyluridine(34)-2'-O)-methyltransferase TrmL [Ectothiorhodospiraceae bacterium BW-2]|nr:tRNA (uridine(34)/cytosine(34)/5-carboxymethylaminomethyluridine(34)-2'-O)-methyltransferase TrmL [Ectothiorhodospiraceae bacterium BW-2]
MLHIILYQPEIPPNTGNIIRLCANSGARLHLVEPLGFQWEDSRLRRAGLDYHEFASVGRYPSLAECRRQNRFNTLYACTTKAKQHYHQVSYHSNDALLFGPETRGLPDEIRQQFSSTQIRIPMRAQSRSLNLSNACAIILYEALRQLGFESIG